MNSYLLIASAAVLVSLSSLASAQEAPRTTIQPQDTGEALNSPGMGWVLHFYDNVPSNYGSQLAYSDTVDDFPGLTVVYLRIPWSYIEPEEGKFNWSVVDSPGQRYIAKGKQVAFRFSCSESWMRYATPEWVERAGAKGHNLLPARASTRKARSGSRTMTTPCSWRSSTASSRPPRRGMTATRPSRSMTSGPSASEARSTPHSRDIGPSKPAPPAHGPADHRMCPREDILQWAQARASTETPSSRPQSRPLGRRADMSVAVPDTQEATQ